MSLDLILVQCMNVYNVRGLKYEQMEHVAMELSYSVLLALPRIIAFTSHYITVQCQDCR